MAKTAGDRCSLAWVRCAGYHPRVRPGWGISVLTSLLAGLKQSLGREIDRIRQKPFLDASMAGCALVCMADGQVSFSERDRMDGVLRNLEAFQVFDAHGAIDLFNDHVDRMMQDPDSGASEALAAVSDLRDMPELASLLVKVCVALSYADGEFSDAERDAIAIICHKLFLDPKKFDI